jgi:WD40 repeat protein
MSASRVLRFAVAVVGFGLGTAVLAAPQTTGREEELRRQQAELIRRLELQAQGKQPTQPPKAKVEPKPLPAPLPAALPEGAVARLGDTRLRHAATATSVAFSPDGRRLFSGGNDGALRVWDVATGEAVTALHVPSGTVSALRFTHGGKRLAVSFADTQLRFLHPDTLKPDSTFQLGYGSEFAVSGDGQLIAGIGPTGALVVTELGSELPKLELPIQSAAGVHFAFHPDGKTIAVGERTGVVTFYMLAGGKPVLTLDHGAPIRGLVFRADGKRIAAGASAPADVIKVWDIDGVKDAKNLKPVAEIEGASAPQAWLTPDRIAAATREGAGVYDLAEKKWVAFAKAGVSEWAVSPDGTKLAATGSGALRVRMWDLTTGKQLHADNDTFPDAALLVPTPDGKSVFVLADEFAYHWPVEKSAASPAGRVPLGRALEAAVGKDRLAVAIPGGVLVYDNFDPAKPLPAKHDRALREHSAKVRSIAVSPDGKKIAYSGQTGDESRIVIADAGKGETVRVLPSQTIALGLAFSPDSSKLAVVGRDGFLRLWAAGPVTADDDTDLWRARVQRGPRGSVAFSPDGRMIAASSSTLVLVVDAATGEELFKLDRRDFEDGIFQLVAFSPDSQLLVTGSAGLPGAVQVWEVATRSLVRRYTTGLGAVNRLAVFPDGSRAVTAGAEDVVTAWDLTFRRGQGAPKADEMVAAWADLDSLDAAKGYPAVRALVAGGTGGVRVVTAGLEDTLNTQKLIAQWVKQLGAEEFADREAATKALERHGFQALPAVQAAASGAESQEVRTRATEIIDKLTAKGLIVPSHGLAGDTLRLVRAVQVLEAIGGSEAEALLKKVADLGGRPGDAAKAALKRLKK